MNIVLMKNAKGQIVFVSVQNDAREALYALNDCFNYADTLHDDCMWEGGQGFEILLGQQGLFSLYNDTSHGLTICVGRGMKLHQIKGVVFDRVLSQSELLVYRHVTGGKHDRYWLLNTYTPKIMDFPVQLSGDDVWSKYLSDGQGNKVECKWYVTYYTKDN